MLDTVKINHVQHISFTQSRLTDAVSVILSELLSYEHPSKLRGLFFFMNGVCRSKVGLVNPGGLVYNTMYCQNGCGMQRRRT